MLSCQWAGELVSWWASELVSWSKPKASLHFTWPPASDVAGVSAAAATADITQRQLRNKCSTCSFCMHFWRSSKANGSSKTEQSKTIMFCGRKRGKSGRKAWKGLRGVGKNAFGKRQWKTLLANVYLKTKTSCWRAVFFHFQRKRIRTRNGWCSRGFLD